jgi:hypothetical protein
MQELSHENRKTMDPAHDHEAKLGKSANADSVISTEVSRP